jgi:hypothetical protein
MTCLTELDRLRTDAPLHRPLLPPLATTMDWHHSVEERGPNQRQVTFRVVASGPSSLVLAPVLRRILQGELPQTVDKLINLAEHP